MKQLKNQQKEEKKEKESKEENIQFFQDYLSTQLINVPTLNNPKFHYFRSPGKESHKAVFIPPCC
ncbi:MAG: hypothetical protein ACKOXB_13785 [Flavobacteriales bacterium]